MKAYFSLQARRLVRSIVHFGIPVYPGIAIVVIAFVGLSVLLYSRLAWPHRIYPLLPILAVYSLGNAHRNEFLQNIFTNKGYRQVRLLENLLVAVPFILFLVFKQEWAGILIVLLGTSLLSLYNKADRSRMAIPTPFSKKPFEFTIGFRKNWWLLLLIYAVAVIGIYVNNFNLGLVALGVSLLVCMNFYAKPEPEFFVWVFAYTPERFLQRKVKTAIVYTLYVSAPIAVGLICFFPADAFIPLAIVVIGLLDVVMGVLAKYAIYPQEMEMMHLIKMIAGLLCPPLLIVLIPHFYKRSLHQLMPWLS